MPSLVFHPDMPAPAGPPPTTTADLASSGRRQLSLADVAAFGIGDDDVAMNADGSPSAQHQPAGGIFVCLGAGGSAKDGAGTSGTLSKPRLCYLTLEGPTEVVASQPPFASLPANAAISRAGGGAAERPPTAARAYSRLIIQTIARQAASGGVRQQRAVSAPRKGATVHGPQSQQQQPSQKRSGGAPSSSALATRKPFDTSTLIDDGPTELPPVPRRRANSSAAASSGGGVGMRTAARAASRARQDAQIKGAAVPNERQLKAEKHAFLSGLSSAGVASASNSPPNAPSSSAGQKGARESVPDGSTPAARIVVSLPCRRARLNESTLVLQPAHMETYPPQATQEGVSGARDVILSFTNPATLATFEALLAAGGEGPQQQQKIFPPHATSLHAAAAHRDPYGPVYGSGEWGAGPAEPPELSVIADDGLLLRRSGPQHLNDATSQQLESAASLRERLSDTRFRYVSNDHRPLSPHRRGESAAAAADGDFYSLPRAAPSVAPFHTHRGQQQQQPLLGPAGREVDPQSVADLLLLPLGGALLPTPSALRTPAERQEHHWRLQEGFNRAREGLARAEERRRRDVRALFEERDRRREAFLRKRAMLREEVIVPPEVLLAAEGHSPSEIPRLVAAQQEAAAAQAMGGGTLANGSGVVNAAAAAADAHWEAFGYVASALGKKWERSDGVDVDALIVGSPTMGAADGGGNPSVDPLPFGRSPLHQMSPDAVMRRQMASGGYGGEGASEAFPFPQASSDGQQSGGGSLLQQFAPDIAALVAREESVGTLGGAFPNHPHPHAPNPQMLQHGHVMPAVGPSSAALNAYYAHLQGQHSHALAQQTQHVGPDGSVFTVPAQPYPHPHSGSGGGGAPSVAPHRSASADSTITAATTATNALSALDKLRASRQPSINRGASVAATVLGGAEGGAAEGSVAPTAPEDPIQAALRAEARLLKGVHTRLPSAPLPPLAPSAPQPSAAPPVAAAVPKAEAAAAPATATEVEPAPAAAPPAPVAPPPPKKAPPPPPLAKKAPPAPTAAPTDTPTPSSPLGATAVVTPTSAASPTAAGSPQLPPGWKEGKADDGRTFYWNAATKERSWKFPGAAAGGGGTSVSASSNASAPSAATPAEAPLPSGWREVSDPKTGKPYYYNTATRETTKVRPTAASSGGGAAGVPAPPAPPKMPGGVPPPPPPKPATAASASASVLPPGWKEVKAPDGRAYYYNATTKERSWKVPTA